MYHTEDQATLRPDHCSLGAIVLLSAHDHVAQAKPDAIWRAPAWLLILNAHLLNHGHAAWSGMALDSQRPPVNHAASSDLSAAATSHFPWHAESLQDALAGEVAREGICANKLGSRAAYPYLHATLREAHRLTPAAPINLVKKNLQGPVTVHGREFPPGTTFILNTYFPGHDPERVPEPNIFDPERFLPPAEAARKGTPAAILDHTLYRAPFSAGARQCPGSRVAMLEVQALLLTFIRDWKIEPVDPSITWDKVSYFQGTLVQPHMPTLRFTSRN